MLTGEDERVETPAAGGFRVYDTRTSTVLDLETVVPGQVSVYHCGLTVQSAPHVGHIRKEVVFDVLRRWLTHLGLEVTVVANVTDIDDKILAKAAANGEPWWALAYRFERELHTAYDALGCLRPTYEPRATGHIPEMIELIKVLIERGHAYAAEDGSGDVYFDVLSWPAYGELSHQAVADMEPAADADPRGKRDSRDFALWKGHKPGEPETASWWTPWGRGRPGWHLECSAMAAKYLGSEFDIHGGGLDLRFPHHENELAQSTAAGQKFARYWMHNGWVTAAGEKMSKSLGNGALVSEVVKNYPPRAVRFYLAAPHYRSAIEFSDTSLAEATAALDRIDTFVQRATVLAGPVDPVVPDAFATEMNDDLGTPGAVAVLYTAVRHGNSALAAGDKETVAVALAEVRGMLGVLGLDLDDPAWQGSAQDDRLEGVVDGLVAAVLEQRTQARRNRDFATADALRDLLAQVGIEVADTPQGAEWSLKHTHDNQLGERLMPGNSQRKGAVRRKGKGNTAGSGGRVRRGLEGRGPTPKAEDRPYHVAHKRAAGDERPSTARGNAPKRTGRPGSGPEWVVGRNAVLEAMEAQIPVKSAYVAEGAERDDRLREVFKLAADRSTPMLQVTRAELDRLTAGAIHQGLALQLPEYTYAHPDDLLAAALDSGTEPLIVALDSITDPRNLGAVIRSAAAFGAHGVLIPERRSAGMTAAAWKTSAGAAARLPVARATNLNRTLRAYSDAGLRLVGLDGEADTDLAATEGISGPLVLVVGSEGAGLSRLVREACDSMASIPMTNTVESLNAGVAAGIALYEISRQRRTP